MAGLTVQNFASAAAGIAVAIALVRGFARQEKKTIGNFWVDVTRATIYVLLPLSIVAGLLFCTQGAVQNLKPYTGVTTVEGAKQTIAQGPVASQEAEAGVDDFLAQATPKDKLEYIQKEQAAGRLVAMTGDGTNDAPALAQADVRLAMNTGTMEHGGPGQQSYQAD